MMRDVFALAHEEFDDVEMEGGPSDFLDAIGGALLQACDVYCRKQGRDPDTSAPRTGGTRAGGHSSGPATSASDARHAESGSRCTT
jgi:hypothetical protein